MSHLTEEQLNAYLDDALSKAVRTSVAAHLASCDACRAELASLRALFDALDALRPEAVPIDLVTLVTKEIAAERRRTTWGRRVGWLVPALQGLAAVLFLIFGWPALAAQYETLAQRIPEEALIRAWQDALTGGNLLWTAAAAQWQTWFAEIGSEMSSLPTALGRSLDRWPHIPGLGLETIQVVILILAAALMWLAGNSILLRAAIAPSRTDRPARRTTNHS